MQAFPSNSIIVMRTRLVGQYNGDYEEVFTGFEQRALQTESLIPHKGKSAQIWTRSSDRHDLTTDIRKVIVQMICTMKCLCKMGPFLQSSA